MAWVAPVAAVIGTVMSAKGSVDAGNAAAAGGKAEQKLANFQADQLDINAGQEVAAGQRTAEVTNREAELLMSRAQAVAAASGAGALDPTVLNIIGGIASEGKLKANTQRYNSEEDARSMRGEAKALRYSGGQSRLAGEVKKGASRTAALTTVVSNAGAFKNAWQAVVK